MSDLIRLIVCVAVFFRSKFQARVEFWPRLFSAPATLKGLTAILAPPLTVPQERTLCRSHEFSRSLQEQDVQTEKEYPRDQHKAVPTQKVCRSHAWEWQLAPCRCATAG